MTTSLICINNFKLGKYGENTDINDPHLSLLETEDEVNFKILFPACRCKDFFNEVFNKIYTGRNTLIYGFNTATIDISNVKDSEYFYLLIVPRHVDINIELMQSFLDLFKPASEVLSTIVDDKISAIIKFHRNWTDRPYLVSMFINLCRISQLYNGNGFEGFKEYLSNNGIIKTKTIGLACIKQFLDSLKVMEDYLNGIVHEQSFDEYDTKNYDGVRKLHNFSGTVSLTNILNGTFTDD